jgi:hypothetical protein
MFPEMPHSITGRLPATSSREARAGRVMIDFQFLSEYDRFVDGDHWVRLCGAQIVTALNI